MQTSSSNNQRDHFKVKQHNNSAGQQQNHSRQDNNNVSLDDSWTCVFCHKICHYRGLGDLFGPYNIDFSEISEKCKNSNTSNNVQITPKRSKYSLLNHNYAVKEVWMHEDCLVWSEGIHLVGKKIIKLEDVIKASFNHNCTICKTKGATIGCAGKRCRRKFHYVCARDDKGCLLDEANFSLKCDKCLANTAASLSLSMNL